MKTSLLAFALLALPLPLGCSAEAEEPNPLATRAGFCKAWGQAACQTAVVDACNAATPEDCVETQSNFCETLVPRTYDAAKAEACIGAVKAAYADADLTGAELEVVRSLGAPCDQLSKGVLQEGEICSQTAECNAAAGFRCITKLGAATGSCEKPELVMPAEACDLPNQVCGEGNYCNGDNCVVYKKVGRPCSGDYECTPEDRCVVPEAAEEGTCTARLGLSEVCSADADCSSHYCVRESGATEGECASKIRLSFSEPLCDDLK